MSSYKTIYNYIDEGLFPNLTNKHLPVKKNEKKQKHNKVRQAINNTKGTSISQRNEEIESREESGHWEMDTVVGKKGASEVLLVLTERKTREEIIRKMKSKSQYCVVKELDKIERKLGSKKFRETFKTITCDNGCENLDYEGIERSVLTKQSRTKVYYAHPYSAWERGSNENANKFFRVVEEELDRFSSGEEISCGYDFDFCLRTESYIHYVSFHFEADGIDVSDGGSVYDPAIGSDSYTSWMYSIWRNGTSDVSEFNAPDFTSIVELVSEGARLSVSNPDEFFMDDSEEPEN